ncbi:MAG: hypothetical protein Q4B59_05845 [Lachnospiraceae bacterium]|nr:hypothetical protein [Lachnospiraceae bacterium]
MKKATRIVIRLLAIAVIIGVAVAMAIIGRGHTIYLDNKDHEYNGTTYEAFYKVEVLDANMKATQKLSAGDRGMESVMGQKYSTVVAVTRKEGDKREGFMITYQIPYGMDGVILNIPAYLGAADGETPAPEEAYMEEFIPVEVEDDTEEVVLGDEFDLTAEG